MKWVAPNPFKDNGIWKTHTRKSREGQWNVPVPGRRIFAHFYKAHQKFPRYFSNVHPTLANQNYKLETKNDSTSSQRVGIAQKLNKNTCWLSRILYFPYFQSLSNFQQIQKIYDSTSDEFFLISFSMLQLHLFSFICTSEILWQKIFNFPSIKYLHY